MDNKPADNFNKYLSVKYILSFSFINYLQSGISFLVSIILARELGRTEYGYFTYGMVFTSIILIVMQFGTDRTLVRDFVQFETPDIIISSAAWLWGLLGSLLIAGVSVWLFFISSLSPKAIAVVLICTVLGFVRGMSPVPWFDFKGKANYQSFILVIDRLLFLVLTIAAIYFFKKSPEAIVIIAATQLLARLITIIPEYRFLSSTARLVVKPIWPEIYKIIKDNIWVWLGASGNLLMTQANQLMLNGKYGVNELALYGFAFQVIMVIRLLQQQILRLITPAVSVVTKNLQTNTKHAKAKLFQFCGIIALISACVILPAYYIIPYFIKYYINKNFLPSVPILNVLYIWVMVNGVSMIINQFCFGLRLQKFYFISTTSFGLISLLLAEVCISRYGAMGAAISLLIATTGTMLVQLMVVLNRINKAPVEITEQ